MATQSEIQLHYDVSNDFYSLFLDKRYRNYSCGVWKTAQTLEDAQEHKLDRICRYARISPGDRIIDVGCGWGGLMHYAIESCEAESAQGLTLSEDQFCFVKETAGQFNINIELCSWQDYRQREKLLFSAITSVGAFEHFASLEDRRAGRQRSIYRDFFSWCQLISTHDAFIGLQTIITNRPPASLSELRDTQYLLKKVFPGSALPSLSDIQIASADLYEINSLKRIGMDYALTLDEWLLRLQRNRTEVIERFDLELFTHYQNYFLAARRSFQAGVVDLVQISLKPVQLMNFFR